MASNRSATDDISENNAPKVHLKYEVDNDGALETLDLPFIGAVLADLSGDNEENKKDLHERDFVSINSADFSNRMTAINPTLTLQVKNRLGSGSANMNVHLSFTEVGDFDPGKVAAQAAKSVPQLATLLDRRKALEELQRTNDRKAVATLERLLADPKLMESWQAAKAKLAENGDPQ